MSKEQVRLVAEKVAGEWKNLATELAFKDDELSYIEGEYGDTVGQAEYMLTLWQVCTFYCTSIRMWEIFRLI